MTFRYLLTKNFVVFSFICWCNKLLINFLKLSCSYIFNKFCLFIFSCFLNTLGCIQYTNIFFEKFYINICK